MKRSLIIAIILGGVALAIGSIIYFVSGVSATYPPIKVYQLTENVSQSVNIIQGFVSKKPGMKFSITDTTGTKEEGYAYYATLRINDSLEYSLKFEDKDGSSSFGVTNMALILAYNNVTIRGGYSKQAKGVTSIICHFDDLVINSLRKEQKINIISPK